jgi:hypothetical protein
MNSNHYFPHDHDEHGTRERVEEEAGALHRNSFDNQVEVVQALAGVENLAEDMEVESLNFIKHCHKKMHMHPGLLLAGKKINFAKGKIEPKRKGEHGQLLETYLAAVVNGGGGGGHSFC